MNLHARLNQLKAESGHSLQVSSSTETLNPLQQRLQRIRQSRPANRTVNPENHQLLAGKIDGELREGYIYRREVIPLAQGNDKEHGTIGFNVDPLPGDSAKPGSDYIYIDIETTGLSGGSGTVAFLYGVARVGREAIVLEQYLLTGYSGEVPMLTAMTTDVSGKDTLVSYNGKSFDIPLLQTRFRMHHQQNPFEGMAHCDLLHPVRRLFKSTWSDCRLETVERRLLNIHRVDDLNGAEAPDAWFDYVRHGCDKRLLQIVQHHRQDILSLVRLQRKLGDVIKAPVEYDASIYHLAKWLDNHDPQSALTLLENERDHLCDEALSLLAWKYRKLRRWDAAVEVWKQLSEKCDIDAIEHLAKYYEHHAKSYKKAYEWTLRLTPGDGRMKRAERLREKMSYLC